MVEPFFVCPCFEEDRAREQLNQGPFGRTPIFSLGRRTKAPIISLRRALRRARYHGRLGIEETEPFVFSEGLPEPRPACDLVSATPVTAGCRMIKSPAELR